MIEVHVNFAGAEEAAGIAREAVEKRLAACANLFGPLRSIYWWDGAVQDEQEVAVVFKTTDDGAGALVDFITARHSYKVPGIVVHQAMGGHGPYLDWVERETRKPA